MTTMRFLTAAVVAAVFAGESGKAALLPLGQDTSSPLYADFTSQGLNVSYSYSSTTSTGTFTASTKSPTPATSNAFTANSGSPGTGSFSENGFSGYYTLNATVQDKGGQWEVTGGTVDVYGALTGVTTSGTDLLLALNLKTGANTFGYGASKTTIFDFLFTVANSSLQNPNASKIVSDFLGVGVGQGGIILNVGTYNPVASYTGDFTKNFSNTTGTGQADTFVPEPEAFPIAMSLAALGYLIFVRTNSDGSRRRTLA